MIRAAWPVLLSLGVLIPACHRAGGGALTPAAGTTAPDSQPLTDPQIAGVLSSANSNELQQARIAIRRAQRADVRDYARLLVAHHEQATNDARASARPRPPE